MKKIVTASVLVSSMASAFVPNSMRAAEPRWSRRQKAAGGASLLAGALGIGSWLWARTSGADGGVRDAREEGSLSGDGEDGSSARESGEADNEDTFRTGRLLSFAYHGPENGAVFAEGPYFSYLVCHNDPAQPIGHEVVAALEAYAATVNTELIESLDSSLSSSPYDGFADLSRTLRSNFIDYLFMLVLIDPLAQSVYFLPLEQETSVIDRSTLLSFQPQIKIFRGIDRKLTDQFNRQVVNAETIVNLATIRQGDGGRYIVLTIPPEHLLLRAENGFDFERQ